MPENLRDWADRPELSERRKVVVKRTSKPEKAYLPQGSKDGGPKKPQRVYRKAKLPQNAPIRAPRTKKNFVMANAIENILGYPKKVTNDSVSGIILHKENGSVPKYLGRVKREIEAEKEQIREEFREQERRRIEANGLTLETPLDEVQFCFGCRLFLFVMLSTSWTEFPLVVVTFDVLRRTVHPLVFNVHCTVGVVPDYAILYSQIVVFQKSYIMKYKNYKLKDDTIVNNVMCIERKT